MRLAPWLRFGANVMLAMSILIALASVAEAARGAASSWVAVLIAIALTLWIAGTGLDALASIARLDEATRDDG